MNRTLVFAAAAALSASHAGAAIITNLTPAQINGGNTATASFSDGNVTLTPFIGATQATFNPNATRLGIDDQTGTGTNANAFNDPDTNPNSGNEERLVFQFAPGHGLNNISYDFSRADGATADDGVRISGFLYDPAVTFSPTVAGLTASYDGAGSVLINIPGSAFSGTVRTISFDPGASFGQTLSLKVTDTDQAGAQLAVRGISYATPEPTAAALAVLGAVATAVRRRSV